MAAVGPVASSPVTTDVSYTLHIYLAASVLQAGWSFSSTSFLDI